MQREHDSLTLLRGKRFPLARRAISRRAEACQSFRDTDASSLLLVYACAKPAATRASRARSLEN
jgi:hypothetical protein